MAAEVLVETEGVALWEEYLHTRDVGLRNSLVLRNLGLVYRLANQYAPLVGDSLEDLIQEGCVGLIKAVERFRPDYGVQFSTYAYPVISGAIKNYLRYRRRLLGKQASSRRRDEPETRGSQPELPPLAGEELVAPDDLEAFAGTLSEDFSDQVVASILTEDLLARLPTAEQRIVTHVFYDDLTQREVARLLARSNSRVSRLLRRALDRLRSVLVQVQREEQRVLSVAQSPIVRPGSVVDLETGLFGPAHLRRCLAREVSRAQELHAPLTLALLRPQAPSEGGTPRRLVMTARRIYRRVRVLDHVFRAGPAELALVFSLPEREAARICERLSRHRGAADLAYAVSSYPHDSASPEGLLTAALAELK